jgi:hypothetical protein
MVPHRHLALATVCTATMLLVAVMAVIMGGGAGAGPRRTVVQGSPALAANSRPAAFVVPATDALTTSTTTPATTLAPPTAAPTTVVPTTVAHTTTAPRTVPTTAAPRVVPAPVARPAVTAPPNTAAAGIGGSATDYSLIGYRWNPCKVITVSSSGPDISGIVSELASITGLRLQLVSGIAQITVQWGTVPAGGEIGLTAWRAVGGWLNVAGINISTDAQPYLSTVLRHEMGHALGLGHAANTDEIMSPTAGNSSPTDYQAGDRAGLRAVGAAAGGC